MINYNINFNLTESTDGNQISVKFDLIGTDSTLEVLTTQLAQVSQRLKSYDALMNGAVLSEREIAMTKKTIASWQGTAAWMNSSLNEMVYRFESFMRDLDNLESICDPDDQQKLFNAELRNGLRFPLESDFLC